jgi:hypothetical protein
VSDTSRDYFERARAWAATGLFLAGTLSIVGSFLDWVTISQLPEVIPPDQAARAEPFNGFDVTDGWATLAAGVVMLFAAVMLVVKARSSFAWLGFAAAVVAGGIAISDYRGIEQLFVDLEGIGGDPDPGIGLIFIAIGSLLGLVSAVTGIAATPTTKD